MNPHKALQALGLTEQETNIYTSLFRSGGSAASIIAKEVGLRRTTVYAILQNMAQKGFLSVFTKSGRQIFVAEHPNNLANHFQKKCKNFINAIPLLESMEKTQIQTTGLRFIETIDDLERFYQNMLHEYRNRSYMIMSNGNVWQGADPEFFEQFRIDRNNANIHTRILLTADSKDVPIHNPSPIREIRFLPPQYQFKSSIEIFDDQILIVSPEKSSVAVVIAVPSMVDIFKSTFSMLWNLTPKSKLKVAPKKVDPRQESLLLPKKR